MKVHQFQLNPLTPRVKPWVTHSFLTFDSVDTEPLTVTIQWKAVEQYLTVVPFGIQASVCCFGKFINFVLGTVRSERVNV